MIGNKIKSNIKTHLLTNKSKELDQSLTIKDDLHIHSLSQQIQESNTFRAISNAIKRVGPGTNEELELLKSEDWIYMIVCR